MKLFVRTAMLCGLLLVAGALSLQAQIIEAVKWDIRLIDSESPEKELRFTAKIDRGWHLYDMNLPAGGPVSTAFTFETRQGVELIDKPVASATPKVVRDIHFDMDLRWFTGTVTFTQKIRVTDPKRFKLAGEVEFMACNDETCLPPDRIPFNFDRTHVAKTVMPAGSVATTDTATTEEPAEADIAAGDSASGADHSAATSGIVAGGSTAIGAASPLWTPVIEELKTFGDETAHAADASFLYIFLAGFVGGLIALATPCVWPMIPMTVSFFLKRNKNRRKAITDALIYGGSIIIIYLAMGLLITGIFGASALNDLSTNAVFNIIFFLLLVVFAVSFFGAFEMVLPASWTNKMDAKADATSGILSIFLMAFTLALVSFSCTGPIIGTLLVEAASQGVAVGPAVGMLGFSIALAIPFALFAIFPNMLQSMPKSGGWLNSVKVVLGFLELALALKFLSVADLAYGWRILDREVFLSLWIIIFTLLGIYLLGKLKFKHDSDMTHVPVARLFMAIISFAFAIYMVPGLWGAPLKSISAFSPPLYTQDFNLYDQEVHAAFDDYETGLAYAQKTGKPVLIDFSGFGCVNCRKMEASVWTDPKVKQLLEEKFVLITLMVDDKNSLPQTIDIEENGRQRRLKTVGDKWSYLQRYKFGANAQPFYVAVDGEGRLLSPSYAYDEDVSKYIDFLNRALEEHQNRTSAATAE